MEELSMANESYNAQREALNTTKELVVALARSGGSTPSAEYIQGIYDQFLKLADEIEKSQ